jgi:hypothetical protein
MKPTKDRGTPDASVRGRPLRRGRWRQTWQASAALTSAVVVATILAAGCSSAPAPSGLTTGGTAAGGTVADQLLIQGDQDLVNFARCMRAHGVQMSDPYHQPGHMGLTVNLPRQDSATRTAWSACRHYIQALVQIKEDRMAALAGPRMAALTRYAECMRVHDITMLDPNTQGELNLGDVPGMASNGFSRYSPQFRSADAVCRRLLPAGTADDGTGP